MKFITISSILLFTALTISAHGGSRYEQPYFSASEKAGDRASILMVHFSTPPCRDPCIVG